MIAPPKVNPFSNPSLPPTWAQLTRLGGDHVAVLFEELRKLISRNPDILERLHYAGPEQGWVARYDLDGTALFTARILPGTLEAGMEFGPATRTKLLSGSKLPAHLRELLQASPVHSFKVSLRSSSSVRAFARLVLARVNL